MRALLVTLVGLLLAAPAGATSGWARWGEPLAACTGTDCNSSVGPGSWVYSNITETDEDTGYLDTTACEATDVFFEPDTTGSATDAEFYVYQVLGDRAGTVANYRKKVLADLTGGGILPADDLPLNGDDGSTANQRYAIYNVPGPMNYLEVSDPNSTMVGSGDNARVLVHCKAPGGN